MTWAAVAVSAAGVANNLIGGRRAGAALDNANESAVQATAAGTQRQNALTGQQLEIARPGIQTRDNAINTLQVLFGQPVTAPTRFGGAGGVGGGGIGGGGTRLNGVTNVIGGQGRPQVGITAVPLGDGRFQFVDDLGTVVAEGGEGDTLSGLVHGRDNPVVIRNGQVIDGKGGDVLADASAITQRGEDASAAVEPQGGLDLSNRDDVIATLMDTPGIGFIREQGEQTIDRANTARGGFFSGAAVDDLTKFSNDLTATQFTNAVLNPLFQLAGFGQQSSGQAQNALGQAGANAGSTADLLAQLAANGGANQAALAGQQTSAINSGLQNGLLAFLQNQNPGTVQGNQPVTDPLGTPSSSRFALPPPSTPQDFGFAALPDPRLTRNTTGRG